MTNLEIQLAILRHLETGQSSMTPKVFDLVLFESEWDRIRQFKSAIKSLVAQGLITKPEHLGDRFGDMRGAYMTSEGRLFLERNPTVVQSAKKLFFGFLTYSSILIYTNIVTCIITAFIASWITARVTSTHVDKTMPIEQVQTTTSQPMH